MCGSGWPAGWTRLECAPLDDGPMIIWGLCCSAPFVCTGLYCTVHLPIAGYCTVARHVRVFEVHGFLVLVAIVCVSWLWRDVQQDKPGIRVCLSSCGAKQIGTGHVNSFRKHWRSKRFVDTPCTADTKQSSTPTTSNGEAESAEPRLTHGGALFGRPTGHRLANRPTNRRMIRPSLPLERTVQTCVQMTVKLLT